MAVNGPFYILIYIYIYIVYELVGLFFLHSLEKRFGEKIGLYRHGGLIALSTTSGRFVDKARKDLISMFENFGLKITARANLKDLLNNLSTNTFHLQTNYTNYLTAAQYV